MAAQFLPMIMSLFASQQGGGGSGGGGGGGPSFDIMANSKDANKKFQASSAEMDALVRQNLMANIPAFDLSPKLGSTTSFDPAIPNAGAGIAQSKGTGAENIAGFLKNLITPDESDTAIPEEPETEIANVRREKRAEKQLGTAGEDLNFYSELTKLFTRE